MNALGNRAQTARAVINRVHRRDDREQNLGGANITRCLVAADVLLARLQREPIRRPAFRVVRNTDESAWHMTLVLIARCKERRVWSTKSERNSEALCAADGNI